MTRKNPPLEDLLHTDHDVVYGVAERLSPLVRRITAPNPGPFTFHGTGTYLVGEREVAVIDPGPDDEHHIQAVLRAVARGRVKVILVTHTHADHSPAARSLAERTGATVMGFGPHPPAETSGEEPGDRDFLPEETLAAGDIVEGDGWTLECLHTPGHISNHLCYALEEEGGVFTGDHIMGWSSTVIPPPDGSLSDYLASLELMESRRGRDDVYWPAHGPAIQNPVTLATALREHRLERTRQVLESLRSGCDSIPEIVAHVYPDLSPPLIPAAQMTVLAHLIHLTEQGKVACEGVPRMDVRYSPA